MSRRKKAEALVERDQTLQGLFGQLRGLLAEAEKLLESEENKT